MSDKKQWAVFIPSTVPRWYTEQGRIVKSDSAREAEEVRKRAQGKVLVLKVEVREFTRADESRKRSRGNPGQV